jgi:membrane-bound lytic murein transglycosylase MltF
MYKRDEPLDGRFGEMPMTLFRSAAASLLAVFAALSIGWQPHRAYAADPPKAAAPARANSSAEERRLEVTTKPWKGDFDGMLERRAVRVFVPYSRSLYFVDKGRERGISAQLIREFERWLNKKYAKQLGNRPITVFVVPATRDRLRGALLEGYADLAVGNIKVIDELTKDLDFATPDETAASAEVLVTGPASPAVASIGDLSGKKVYVRKVSSYYHSLLALNERFKTEGKPPVDIVLVPDALEEEDLMEMVNVGLIHATVVDDWKAKAWATLLPKVRVHEDIVLRPKTKVGWAMRKQSPKLAAEINEFYAQFAKARGTMGGRLEKEYVGRVKALNNAAAAKERERFEALIDVFEKYGQQYKFDPLMLAAQGYQESQLDQSAKSHVGAIGIMQIMPATGAELKVGDIRQAEPNIHGGAKYMDQLMTRYFPDAKFDEQNRTLFAFASYNAGPGNISRMRKEAEKRGLDPNQWFNNVEIVTAEKIGIETTTYVRNIFKYYAAYRLTTEARLSAERLKQQAVPAKK